MEHHAGDPCLKQRAGKNSNRYETSKIIFLILYLFGTLRVDSKWLCKRWKTHKLYRLNSFPFSPPLSPPLNPLHLSTSLPFFLISFVLFFFLSLMYIAVPLILISLTLWKEQAFVIWTLKFETWRSFTGDRNSITAKVRS